MNYRTTDEIRRWACAQLEGCAIDDLDGELDSLKGYRSLTHGEAPDVLRSESLAQDLAHHETILRQLTEDGTPSQQVCIAARTNNALDAYAEGLAGLGIAHLRLDRTTADDQSSPGVRLATMHRIKGLEFDVVILAGYQGPQAYAKEFSRDADVGVNDAIETAERCLLHVAATRAKGHLFVLGRCSESIATGAS